MRTKRLSGIIGIGCLLVLLGLASPPGVSADVSPGDVIDKTNWQKAEGLLPESVLNWVKNGDYILNIGELTYDPEVYITDAYEESKKENIGKYALDEGDIIIDATTGKDPGFIEGIPFPDVDLEDPRAGTKLMYNKQYHLAQLGNINLRNQAVWIGKSGYEREVSNSFVNVQMDGFPEARSLRNPDGFRKKTLIAVDEPFDIAGFAMLSWRYRDKRQDVTFAYVPSIRRVRRMSPANRSDSFLGSDFCVDDPAGYDGKVSLFAWKVIGQKEALAIYRSTKPERLVRGKKGELQTTPGITDIEYGYETEGWQGAPWAHVNAVWVKEPVILIEGIAKDPYYNYGRLILWYDPVLGVPKFKVIHDRSGQYWKTMVIGATGYETDDGTLRVPGIDVQDVVDDRTRHSSQNRTASPDNIWKVYVEVDMADFSMAGFQKYCK